MSEKSTDLAKRLTDADAHYSAIMVEGANSYVLDMLREAASEILRLRALTEWHPIKTAPKDGTVILVSFGTIGVHAVSWTQGAHTDWHSWCVHDRKFGPYPLRGWHPEHSSAPTHWLPLPNAPEGDDDE